MTDLVAHGLQDRAAQPIVGLEVQLTMDREGHVMPVQVDHAIRVRGYRRELPQCLLLIPGPNITAMSESLL